METHIMTSTTSTGSTPSPTGNGVPLDIDREVARLKLAAMGVEIDALTEVQAKYLASWEHGT